MPKRPYPEYRRRHDAILLSILRNPLQTQRQLARETGYSPSQISRIVCSPDFRERYEALFYDTASQTARYRWLGR
jgi:hypothetical protein